MNGTSERKTSRQKTVLMVELVGPAGAGKTSVCRCLRQRDANAVIGEDLELRKRANIPIFIENVVSLLPVFARSCRCTRWFTWDEIKSMVYLQGWHRVLRQRATNDHTIMLLDHGPIFKLATLHAFGPERFATQVAEAWWHDMYRQWASALDIVVWLDAPDSILGKRIDAREQRHAVKGHPEPDVVEFLARYRTSFEYVLARLAAHGARKLLRFDTSQTSTEQVADEVLAACSEEAYRGEYRFMPPSDRATLVK